jgi:hypothetical protein
MLNESNAQELTQIAEEVGALVLRGRVQRSGTNTSSLCRSGVLKLRRQPHRERGGNAKWLVGGA